MSHRHRIVLQDPPRARPSEKAKNTAIARSKSNELKERPLFDEWDPASWQLKPVTQDVIYDDREGLETALTKLEILPPLVHPEEIRRLQQQLSEASRDERFVLQGGDCAELFAYCNQDQIEAKLKVILQMSLVLVWGTKKPILRIGRIAGQYAKPRSKQTESVPGMGDILSFRGDNVNGFDVHSRTPDPSRLVEAYFHSAATLNFVRGTLNAGFADLHHPQNWDFSYVQQDSTRKRYESIVSGISEGLNFMNIVGEGNSQVLSGVDFFTSHEALMLEYEQCLTRIHTDGKYYDTSAHFVWIGDRTRQLNGAHVEFFRGLANPIGIKVGPSMDTDELVRLLDIVDPERVDGRVTLITRYGVDNIASKLPSQIRAVSQSGHRVVWISDPCHGNTKVSPVTRLKTRYFDDITTELKLALTIHKDCGSTLNGVHLELTGDPVTECIGGAQNLEDEELTIRYDTVCDPRLSVSQSLDVAFLIADYASQIRQRE